LEKEDEALAEFQVGTVQLETLPGWTLQAFPACLAFVPALRCVPESTGCSPHCSHSGHREEKATEETLQQTVLYTRRVTPRAEADESVYAFWYCNGQGDLSHVQNLNLGGVFIETSLQRHLGAPVDLYFLVSEGQIRAKAVVRHAEPGQGLGLKFTALNDKDWLRFGALMKRIYSSHCGVKPLEVPCEKRSR